MKKEIQDTIVFKAVSVAAYLGVETVKASMKPPRTPNKKPERAKLKIEKSKSIGEPVGT